MYGVYFFIFEHVGCNLVHFASQSNGKNGVRKIKLNRTEKVFHSFFVNMADANMDTLTPGPSSE